RGSSGLRAPSRHRARPASAVRGTTPGDSHDSRVRSARLRHRARQCTVGRLGILVPCGRLLDGPRRKRDAACLALVALGRGGAGGARAPGTRNRSRSTYLWAPRRSAPRHRRGARGRALASRRPDSSGGSGGGAVGLKLAFFGSSLVSAYWNGAATYYRGILRALATRGHHTAFYEPDAYGRQQHRDIPDPEWARVVVYRGEDGLAKALDEARAADVLVKASGVGV